MSATQNASHAIRSPAHAGQFETHSYFRVAVFFFLLHAAMMFWHYGQLPIAPMLEDEVI